MTSIRNGFHTRTPRLGAAILPICLTALAIAMFAAIETADGAALPSGFVDEVVASGFKLPTTIAFLPDGRLLVAEKSGVVKIVINGAVSPTPFINLSGHVNNYWDRGLLGMAVDPAFAANGRVYFFYPYEHNPSDPSGLKTGRLTRVIANGDSAGSETVLIGSTNGPGCAASDPQCIPLDFYGHSADSLHFAPDGTIFISLGDAASWNNVDDRALRAQNIDEYPGKILRVTTDGEGLPDNPFYDGNPGSIRSRVWALGFRNPFRFSVRPDNGLPYVGDVGWGNWEEINVAAPGANFGWPCHEGPVRQSGYQSKPVCQQLYTQGGVTLPLIAWSHDGKSAAAVGGPFTPAESAFPPEYHGGFFYADYARDWIRYAQVDANDELVGQPLDFANADAPVDLGFGPDGNLYYVSITTGQIHRIAYTPPPTLGGNVDLSDLSGATVNGWGPVELNQSNGEQQAGDGKPLSIGGQVFAKGLGVHAYSEVNYDLGGSCSTFTAQVGVDDETGDAGSVVFQVWNGTATKLYDSGLVLGSDGPLPVTVDISGVNRLRLVVTDGGDGNAHDHADWADAQVACGVDNTAPVIAAISVVPGSDSATVTWQTNEAADSAIEFGSTTAYGFAVSDTALVTNHALLLSGLEPNKAYHYRVLARDAAGNLAMTGDGAFTTSAIDNAVFLSDRRPVATPVNGWGPAEVDQSNGELQPDDGKALTIGGQVFAKGLGVHAFSEVIYDLGGTCSTFTAQVGVDDETGNAGSVIFQVWNGTTTKLFDSGLRLGSDGPLPVMVNISGVNQLRLVVTDGGNGKTKDHADWANPQITCVGG